MHPVEFDNIIRILEGFLGESKNGLSDNGQIQFPCPRCVEEKGEQEISKYNLEVNLYRLVFKCWSCSSVDDSMEGRLSKLIRQYGSSADYQDYKKELEGLRASKLYDITDLDNNFNDKDEEEIVRLPQSFHKIDLDHCPDVRIREYLHKRKIDQTIIDKFNIGYTSRTESEWGMRNRIVIPSYNVFGELNYWVARDFSGKSKMKYKNCPAKKEDIIFQESLIDFDADIILCEGAIDCLYPFNAISMLGKVLSKKSYLYDALVRRAHANIYICLDADTEIKETIKIYKILNVGNLKGKIKYIRLERYKDFGELYESEGKRGIINAVRNAKQFNEIELFLE